MILKPQEPAAASQWDNLALVGMPLLNAALGFLAAYAMTQEAKADWAAAWLAVAFAAFYLLLLRLPARGFLRASSRPLSDLHLTLAVVFLAIAIPLKAQGRWLIIGWLVQGVALLWIARRANSLLLRVLALLSLLLGLFALTVINPQASTTPIFNERFGTYLVAIAIFAFAGWLARSEAGRGRVEHNAPERFPWMTIAAASVLIMNALILLAVGWEIHSYWWYVRWSGNWKLLHDYRMYAQFTYSAFFMFFGAILLGIGFLRRSAFLRWQALLLVAASIAKVFLVDVSELSQGYRILSFLGLGGCCWRSVLSINATGSTCATVTLPRASMKRIRANDETSLAPSHDRCGCAPRDKLLPVSAPHHWIFGYCKPELRDASLRPLRACSAPAC